MQAGSRQLRCTPVPVPALRADFQCNDPVHVALSASWVLVHPDPPALLLVLDEILNVELIVVDRAYCCLLLVLNSNNNNLS